MLGEGGMTATADGRARYLVMAWEEVKEPYCRACSQIAHHSACNRSGSSNQNAHPL